MRQFANPFRGSIAVLLAAAGLAAAQPPGAQAPAQPGRAGTLAPSVSPGSTPPGPSGGPTTPDAASPDSSSATGYAPPSRPVGPDVPWDYSPDYSYHFWFDAGYILDWLKHNPVPAPLVTAGSLGDTIPGALGQPNTSVALGGATGISGAFSGMQVSTGLWLNKNQTFGIETTYFLLPDRANAQNVSTSGQPGSPVLAVPFFDVSGSSTATGRPGESVFVVAGPRLGTTGAQVPGTAGNFIEYVKTNFQGDEVSLLCNVYQAGGLNVDVTTGFRWVRLQDQVTLLVATSGVNPTLAGTFFDSVDSFHAVNGFYGGQVGATVDYRCGAWTFGASTKLALGSMVEQVNVGGFSNTNSGRFVGGIFAQPDSLGEPGNFGRHIKDHFAAVLDENFTVGYQPCTWLRLFAGYNFLYLSSVARPGDQINPAINATLTGLAGSARAAGNGPTVTGAPGPIFLFHDSNFWAEGITFGLEFRY